MAKVLLYFSVTNVIIIIFICIDFQALAFLDCNFDGDMCDWQQDQSDDFDWRRKSGSTSTSSTGPSSDHTTGDGYYIYIEADGEGEGDEARVFSPLQKRGQFCLTFWYSMYGRNMGTLNVYMKLYDGRETLILTKDKNLGNRNWRKAVINNNAIDSYQIVLEGVRGGGRRSDIAVDDISIIPSLCPVDCDYDNGFCNWMQDDDDNFDWKLRKGPTQTSDTGPDADHTSGNGQYVYIDSSDESRNDIAWLVSPLQNAGKYCFSFWYHMYGEGVDRLMVEQLYQNGTTQNMFTKNGNKGQIWHREQLLLHSTTYFKIVIEGRVKYAWWDIRDKGDIAIDDVTLMACQDCDNPRTKNSVVNSTNFEYGSVIEITCNEGYYLNGESPMVCQAGGSWSVSKPTCKLFDCGDRTIPNGKFIAPKGTTFGQTATNVCKIGYILVGYATVACTATGWNSTNKTCELFDCGTRTIPNGKFIAKGGTTFGKTASQICNKGYYTLTGDTNVTCTSTGWDGAVATCIIVDCGDPTPTYATANTTDFKYGSVVEVTCNTGYNPIGQSHVVCQADGSWSPLRPICKPYDCGNRTVPNGEFTALEGTTFGQTAEYVCNIGYTLVGDKSVTCTASGWKGQTATCESVSTDAGNDAVIAVYVVVPVIVVILAVLFAIIFLRRRLLACKKMAKDKFESHNTPTMSFPNSTYAGHAAENQNQTNYSYADASLEVDNEYAIITDDDQNKTKDIADNVYYNTVGDAVTLEEDGSHDYDHTKMTAAHFVDESYSHLLNNNTDTTIEQSYNTTFDLDSGNVPPRKQAQSNIDSYDMLNVNTCNEAAKHIGELTESDYDHAHAGGSDPVELDNYSHLNDENAKQECPELLVSESHDEVEYSNVNENIRENEKTDEKPKAGYEQPIGHKPHYLALDAENQGTIEDDRHYFVLEAEEAYGENHDYFVLEKT